MSQAFRNIFRRAATCASNPVLYIAVVVILLTVVFGQLPRAGRYSEVLQKSSHAPAFGALCLVVLALLARNVRARSGSPGSCLSVRMASVLGGATVVALVVMGAATEGIQALLGRDADLNDVVSDLTGAAGAASGWICAQIHPRYRDHRIAVVLLLVLSAAALGYWLRPLVECASAYWHRAAELPVIAQFESQRDLYFIETNGAIKILRIPPIKRGNGPSTALQVVLGSGSSGITFNEPYPNWRGYRTLALDLTNPSSLPFPLTFRINDRHHNNTYNDRFNMDLLLPSMTRKTFYISLGEVEYAPRSRRMDMRQISTLILFHYGDARGRMVLVNRIWLE